MSTTAACLRGGGKGACPSVRRSRQSSHEETKMNLPKIRASFAAIAAAIAYLVVPSASAAILAQNDFEESRADFVADIDGEDASALTAYNADQPSATAPYPFTGSGAEGFGSKYLAVDTGDATIFREFAAQTSSTYLDTFMQFEPTTGEISYTNVAKIVVYLDAATSNLCVISGTDANDRTPATNRLTSAGIVEPGTWGRLTIKCLSGDVFSFQVLLNGAVLSTAGSVDTFYSLQSGTTVSRVGFKGTGALDDFVARTTDPYIQNPVATIDGEGYASLEDAISEASAGATIVLKGNASLSATVSKALTIDLGGNTLSSSVYQTNLTIADSAETHGSVVFTNGSSVPPFTGETINVLAGLENATLVMNGYVPRNIADGSKYSVVALASDCAIYSTRCNDDNTTTPNAGNANVKWQAFTLASASTAESLPVGAESCYLFNIAGDNLAATSARVSIKSITVKWGNGTHHLATIGGSVDCDAYLVITTDDGKIVAISSVNDSRWAANGSSTFAFDGTVLNPATAYRAQFVTSVDGLSVGETLSSAVMARVNGRFHTSSKYADDTTACFGDSQQNTYSVNMSIVVEKTVASIGSIGYPTLDSALSAAGTESEATISLIADRSESVAIPANVTVAVADGVMFSGTLSGAGKVVYTASPSGTLTFGEWTGTVVLNYADIVNGGDFSAKVNSFGITGSTVEIGENGTINEGWCNADITPALKVTGYVHVNNGSSGTERNFTKVTGSGVFVFGTRGTMVNYKIASLENWNGVITNNASASWIESIVSGDGRIVLASPSADTTVGDGWTGTVVLDYNPSGAPFNPNQYGKSSSCVELATGRSVSGYLNDHVTTKLRVNGSVTLNNGSSGTKRSFYMVSGSGTFIFQAYDGGVGETCNYAVDNLVDWNGTMTVGSSKATVTNIVSGTGSVAFNVALSTPPTVSPEWRGTVAVGWNPSNDGNTAFYINNYGTHADATIQIDGNNGEFKCYPRGSTTYSPNVTAKIVLNANWTTGNGFSGDANATTFAYLSGPGNLTVNDLNSYSYQLVYNITKLDNYTGTLGGRNGKFVITTVNVDSMPAAGTRVVKTAKGTYGAFSGDLALTVGGETTGKHLVYATLEAGEGLYKAVAQYGSSYYATYQDALNARKAAGVPGDITALDASAPVPAGYSITDGKLVRTLKPMVILF